MPVRAWHVGTYALYLRHDGRSTECEIEDPTIIRLAGDVSSLQSLIATSRARTPRIRRNILRTVHTIAIGGRRRFRIRTCTVSECGCGGRIITHTNAFDRSGLRAANPTVLGALTPRCCIPVRAAILGRARALSS